MTCRNNNHWVDMLVLGICGSCKGTLGTPRPERKSDEAEDEGVSFEPSKKALDYEASRENYYTASQEN